MKSISIKEHNKLSQLNKRASNFTGHNSPLPSYLSTINTSLIVVYLQRDHH
ncbi:hypothetical protein Scep_025295 [Stephania cephalantha]|uniref:Uncharacterized protein n=1 Tax=Stephania cephalantha TaxID=152367 RepID=A0AAP0HRF2_9MAGN